MMGRSLAELCRALPLLVTAVAEDAQFGCRR